MISIRFDLLSSFLFHTITLNGSCIRLKIFHKIPHSGISICLFTWDKISRNACWKTCYTTTSWFPSVSGTFFFVASRIILDNPILINSTAHYMRNYFAPICEMQGPYKSCAMGEIIIFNHWLTLNKMYFYYAILQ